MGGFDDDLMDQVGANRLPKPAVKIPASHDPKKKIRMALLGVPYCRGWMLKIDSLVTPAYLGATALQYHRGLMR